MLSIGVDIGGSHITVGAYNLEEKILDRDKIINRKINTHGTKNEILNGWVEAIDSLTAEIRKPIKGIGIAMPGPFDYYNGISKINEVEKLQNLYDVNIRLELAEKLQLLPSQIRFINDATAFSIAEARVGPASEYSKVVAITLGTGLGSSFLINGKPIIKDKTVPEGGFLYDKYCQNEMADNLFSTRGIIKDYRNRSGKKISSVRDLCQLIPDDPVAKDVIELFGERLGDFLRPYLIDFDAEVLVLGGNISKAFDHFGQALKSNLPKLDKIYVSQFGEEAAIIGSALLTDDIYYQKIETTLKLM